MGRKRRWRSGEMRLYLAVLLICLLVAAGLHFFMGGPGDPPRAADVTERDLQRLERFLGKRSQRIDLDRLGEIKETYGDRIADEDLEKLWEIYGEKRGRGDLERHIKSHR